MIGNRHAEYLSPLCIRRWLPPGTPTEDRYGLAVLEPPTWKQPPDVLCAFDRHNAIAHPERVMLHGYVADDKLVRLARRPLAYVASFGRFAGVITPDFSLYRDMAIDERIYHTRIGRAIGALLQSRGLVVVPSVRWAVATDLDFACAGLPPSSVVAVSAHGCSRNREDRHHFGLGLGELLERINPRTVLVHGPMPRDVFARYADRSRFLRYPSDIERGRRPARPPTGEPS